MNGAGLLFSTRFGAMQRSGSRKLVSSGPGASSLIEMT